jgi:hypothetical protein
MTTVFDAGAMQKNDSSTLNDFSKAAAKPIWHLS